MAANLMVTLREEVPAAAMTESWMSEGLFPPRVEDDDEFWEERAFQEDTAGLIGVTWPPRSYSCDFCKRDFRSAQALGGHMNVHRRDRTRLRQSSSMSALATEDHKRWIFPFPTHQETPSHYQLPAFSSSSDQKSLLYPINPNRSIVLSSQLLPSSSFMPAPLSPINSHITNDPIQQHEILPSTDISISPYSSSEHTFPTFPSSPPVSNPVTMNISNSVQSMEISGSDRHHGGFASPMAESAATVRKLQQARGSEPCFPVTSLRKTNKSSSEQEKRIYNIQHQEMISLDEDRDSADDELDLELRLGQTKS